jgi:phosphoribosyl-ATP pyrophosphohydrolase/phosphoribosyl-AMP cyclohydrolase
MSRESMSFSENKGRPASPKLTPCDAHSLSYDQNGLIPAIIQDFYTGKILMLAYMNRESLAKTLETKTTWYYSRSRRKLWNKGETSGHFQYVKRITLDCDRDALLVEVEQKGVACHTGEYSCFHHEVFSSEDAAFHHRDIVSEVYQLIADRKERPKVGSYTNYLFSKGLDKILKKIGEESSEVIIGAKNPGKEELTYELCDLIYHAIVLMVEKGVTIDDLRKELTRRMVAKEIEHVMK